MSAVEQAREAYDNATIHAHGMMFGEGVDKSMAADEAFATLIAAVRAERDAAWREGVEEMRSLSHVPCVCGAHSWESSLAALAARMEAK